MSQPEPLDDETERLVLHAAIYLVTHQHRPETEWPAAPAGVTGLHLRIARGRMTDRIRRNAAGIAAHRDTLSRALPPAGPVLPEHLHDLCLQAAKNADRLGPHGTQPATVEPVEGRWSKLSLVPLALVVAVPWWVGVFVIATWIRSHLP